MLSISVKIPHLKRPSKHADHAHKKLMLALSYASGTDAHAQCAHQKLNDAYLLQNVK
jgi:hypothetical protein